MPAIGRRYVADADRGHGPLLPRGIFASSVLSLLSSAF